MRRSLKTVVMILGAAVFAAAQAAKIDFLRPAACGELLRAEARELNRGHRSGLYDVEVRRADGALIACFRGNSHSSDKLLLDDPA